MMPNQLSAEMAWLTWEHATLVLTAVLLAVSISVPAGVIMMRGQTLRRWGVGFANIAQTVPSLALFGFLLPVPFIGGIGKRTALVALVLYAILPILRNTLVGLSGIDAGIRDSALAMGMTPRQMLWRVELPLALPAIIAGIRIATVATVGTATIAAAIGAGGLGTFIFRGIAMVDSATILAGAVPAAAMALAADGTLAWLEQRLAR